MALLGVALGYPGQDDGDVAVRVRVVSQQRRVRSESLVDFDEFSVDAAGHLVLFSALGDDLAEHRVLLQGLTAPLALPLDRVLGPVRSVGLKVHLEDFVLGEERMTGSQRHHAYSVGVKQQHVIVAGGVLDV